MENIILILGVVLIILIGAWYFVQKKKGKKIDSTEKSTHESEEQTAQF